MISCFYLALIALSIGLVLGLGRFPIAVQLSLFFGEIQLQTNGEKHSTFGLFAHIKENLYCVFLM